MKPRKTPPTRGLVGIAMHVLFGILHFVGAFDAAIPHATARRVATHALAASAYRILGNLAVTLLDRGTNHRINREILVSGALAGAFPAARRRLREIVGQRTHIAKRRDAIADLDRNLKLGEIRGKSGPNTNSLRAIPLKALGSV